MTSKIPSESVPLLSLHQILIAFLSLYDYSEVYGHTGVYMVHSVSCDCVPTLCHRYTMYFRKYVGQLYTDSLVHDENALKYLVSTMGEDNVVLGTDYPFPLGEHHPGKLIESIEDWSHNTKVNLN